MPIDLPGDQTPRVRDFVVVAEMGMEPAALEILCADPSPEFLVREGQSGVMEGSGVREVDVVVERVQVAERPFVAVHEGIALAEHFARMRNRIENGTPGRLVSHVDPDGAADLLGGVGADRVRGVVAGRAVGAVGKDRRTVPFAIEGHPVVATRDRTRLPGSHLAEGEKGVSMGTSILERARLAARVAKEHEGIA